MSAKETVASLKEKEEICKIRKMFDKGCRDCVYYPDRCKGDKNNVRK